MTILSWPLTGRDFLTKYYSSSPPYISYGAELNENNNVVFQIMDDDEKYIRAVSKERLSKGNWHHIAITISNNSLKGYINGVENVSFNRTTEIQFNEEEGIFKIGAWGTESNSFKGFIDEICMYNTFFSSIKVKALYYSGLKSLLAKGLIIENEYQERLKIK
ncbi:MAG: LamG-like jellyroll fold domain-containing protein [Anaerovoracaceae bacterium]